MIVQTVEDLGPANRHSYKELRSHAMMIEYRNGQVCQDLTHNRIAIWLGLACPVANVWTEEMLTGHPAFQINLDDGRVDA